MSETHSTIEYRDIQGFPGYRVGNDGTVWTCWQRRGCGPGKGSISVIGTQWKQLKPKPSKPSCHLHVTLCPGRYERWIHRLVLEAFVGPCPEGMLCRHFPDRNPANNRLENLQWGTHEENSADRIDHGTDKRGEQIPNSKLTDEQVLLIRAEYATGKVYQEELAKRYSVTQSNISRVLSGHTWRNALCPSSEY